MLEIAEDLSTGITRVTYEYSLIGTKHGYLTTLLATTYTSTLPSSPRSLSGTLANIKHIDYIWWRTF